MPASPAIRTSRVKDDDQIAFENGTSFEEACSYPKALDWYAEVKPTGGPWDMCASAGRVATIEACSMGLAIRVHLRSDRSYARLRRSLS